MAGEETERKKNEYEDEWVEYGIWINGERKEGMDVGKRKGKKRKAVDRAYERYAKEMKRGGRR